jgi:hypothetical protein
MKFDSKSILMILCYLLALYGLIVLIRKIMLDDKDKKWFSEQYRFVTLPASCTLQDVKSRKPGCELTPTPEEIREAEARRARFTEKIDPEIEARFKAVDIQGGLQVDAKGCTKNMYQHGICVFDQEDFRYGCYCASGYDAQTCGQNFGNWDGNCCRMCY